MYSVFPEMPVIGAQASGVVFDRVAALLKEVPELVLVAYPTMLVVPFVSQATRTLEPLAEIHGSEPEPPEIFKIFQETPLF